MTLVQSIDKLVEWLNENVCSQITLKLPDDYKNDAGYGVEYVNPAAFPLFVPGKDRLPPSVPAPIPSVCAQLMEGNDALPEHKRLLKIRLCLACWNPGEHGDEVLNPRENVGAYGGHSYYTVTKKAGQAYDRNMDGWRGAFNFVDSVLRELENAEYIAGHRLVKEDGIKYGLFSEDGVIGDYYPYWHSWISFTLEAGVVTKTPEAYSNFL